MKASCNGLALNYKKWKIEETDCNICNSKKLENIFHFIGECSILAEVRSLHLNSSKLSEN